MPIDENATCFNMFVKSYMFNLWAHHGGPPRTNPRADQHSDFELDYSPNADALPGIISLMITFGNYYHGAVHGEGLAADFNYSLSLNRPIAPADLFRTDMNWQMAVSTAANTVFAKMPDYRGDPEGMLQLFSDPGSWALLRSGLRIDTASYEVCSFSCGEPSATIPWSALRSVLKPGGLVDRND